MTKILIVEDEEAISNLIRMSLQKAGYSCEQAMDGESAADRIAEHTYDLVLLDIMLPGMNGYELLNYIKTTNMPVIFITAMGTLDDKVKGLKAGADDYITKPFEMVELLARVESVLRRYHKSEERIEVDDVIIDIPSRTVTRNIALYRETIYENIWQSEYMGDGRTVDLHIQRLRKKLHWEDRIHTVYKVGYRFT